jgi:hypothetical protein
MAEVARFVTVAEVAREVAVRWVGVAVWAGSWAGVALERVRAAGGLGVRSIGQFVMKREKGSDRLQRGQCEGRPQQREKR